MIDDGIQRVEAILADIAAVDVEREQAAWEEAVVANTEIAFQQFVVDFPDSSRVEEAKIRGSVLRWDATEAAAAVLAQIPPNWRDRGLVIRDGVDDLHGMTVENFFVRPFRHEIDEVGDEATTLIAKLGSLSFGQATASVEIDLSQFGSPAARIRFELELSWGGVVRIVSATIQNYQTNRRETGSDFNFIFMTVALVNQLFVPDFR